MYCLASNQYNYHVYGHIHEVEMFIQPNSDLKWELSTYSSKSLLMDRVGVIESNQSSTVISLLEG
ncbi:hypothetical protein [Mesobacillus foraminis]|jgi:hypothetical protein|uniref:Uncharacterized protein n=1 Tax=Mesobacillus foraminis TaxID=279826 RepID=A0A4R2BDN5_9BACI|nr:hypothetical protein [Mesobacillus foraminis]TCN25021.1 hypothetical protein EV146_106223 [Mesobacillus foraminis]